VEGRGNIAVMMPPTTLHRASFGQHYHACAFTAGSDKEDQMIDDFLAEGLGSGVKAVYIVDPEKRDACERRLAPHAASEELLAVTTWADAHLKGGSFDAPRMMASLDEMIREDAATGRGPMRIVGNMGWVKSHPPEHDDLVTYEATVNEVLSRGRTPTVCVYELSWIKSSLMMDLLRAHPLAVVNGVLYENPFFTPAPKLLDEFAARRVAALA
jgi:hypothetical protein